MRFVLHYRGPLKVNGGTTHKHELRCHFHAQLKQLWSQKPLVEIPQWLREPKDPNGYHFLRQIGGFVFAPLVTAEVNAVAELALTLLRPELPGGLVTRGGDIDNRLKTLLDALSMPRLPNALPPNLDPATGEKPIFCLLEDDNLITNLAVRTEQLLGAATDPSHVDVTISVRTRVTRQTFDNGVFA